jgi:WD40 repeat protein
MVLGGDPFTPDHRRLILVTDNRRRTGLRVSDLETGALVWTWTQDRFIQGFVFSADGGRLLVSTSDQQGVQFTSRILDAATGRPLGQPFDLRDNPAWRGVLSPDGRRVGTTRYSPTARVWDTTAAALEVPGSGRSLPHAAIVSQLHFSADGERVLTVAGDEAVRAWDAGTGLPLTPVLKQQGAILTAGFSPDGRGVVTVSGRVVRTWRVAADRPEARVLRPAAPLKRVWFSPDGKHVVTVSGPDREAVLWDADAGRSHTLELPTRAGELEAGFSADGRRLLLARAWSHQPEGDHPDPDDVLVWDARTGERTARIVCAGRCNHALFAPDGDTVLTAQGDGTARLWDAGTGAPRGEPMRLTPGGIRARFTPDGRRVLTATDPDWGPPRDPELRLWDARTGAGCGAVIRPPGQPRQFFRFGIDPAGEEVVTVMRDGTCQLWDAVTGRAVTPPCQVAGAWGKENSSVTAINPDGRRVLVVGVEGRDGGRAQVWDAAGGTAVTPVLRQSNFITQAEFSADGSRLLTASADGTARVWDAGTGELLTVLRHAGQVGRAAFSAGGRRVLTMGTLNPDASPFPPGVDLEVRVWEAATGLALTPAFFSSPPHFPLGDTPRRWFSDDGSRVLLVRGDRSLEVRDLAADPRPVDALREEAEVLSGRRINDAGSVLPLDDDRFQKGWRRLSGR